MKTIRYIKNPGSTSTEKIYNDLILPALSDIPLDIKECLYEEPEAIEGGSVIVYGSTNPLMFREAEVEYIRALTKKGSVIVVSAFPLLAGKDTEFYKEFKDSISHEEKACGAHIPPADLLDSSLGFRTVSKDTLRSSVMAS